MANNLKYGILFSTIRYFQQEAKSLWQYRGIKYQGYLTVGHLMLQHIEARRIGHDAIAAAAVRTPEEMRNMLRGK